MNKEQIYAAQKNMIDWLYDSRELGKNPWKIEYVDTFLLYGMQYYIFRFKTNLFGQWLLGVSGGFEKDSLEPCGHTFSNMQKYDVSTARDDSIQMIEQIREYWMEQAKKFD